jgi:hypothetical protein
MGLINTFDIIPKNASIRTGYIIPNFPISFSSTSEFSSLRIIKINTATNLFIPYHKNLIIKIQTPVKNKGMWLAISSN